MWSSRSKVSPIIVIFKNPKYFHSLGTIIAKFGRLHWDQASGGLTELWPAATYIMVRSGGHYSPLYFKFNLIVKIFSEVGNPIEKVAAIQTSKIHFFV